MENVYIYGAHVRACTLKTYLQLVYPDINILGFLVEDTDRNPTIIDDIKVYGLYKEKIDTDSVVIIATKMKYHEHIRDLLAPFSFNRIIYLTPDVDNRIKRQYFKRRFEQEHKSMCYVEELPYIDNDCNLHLEIDKLFHIYQVKSVYDSRSDDYVIEEEYDSKLIPIQAGAALTDEIIADIRDDSGDNISVKNSSYCELTAAYWLWKHEKSEYIGICHYRRHFVINEQILNAVRYSDIDVVLPVPTGCEPSVRENYIERHRGEDLDKMMSLLKSEYSDYYKSALDVFENNYYYACNMWIMKHQVLNNFALWLFTILEKLEKIWNRTDDKYQRRNIGFMAERLTTLYFIHNQEKYKIAFADKIYIG